MNLPTEYPVHAVGLMSGTSADAIDAVLLRTDGVVPPQVLAHTVIPYPMEIRQHVLSLYEPAAEELDRMGRLDHELGRLFAQAALEVIRRGGLTPDQVQVIGSHGQTVRHRPPHFTLQIGNPFVIAATTGITTVANFRPADMARQGEGAPLTPLFHQALFAQPGKRVAVVNLGGIANLTALPANPEEALLAGDTGPANTLLDLLAELTSHGAQTHDRDGAQAARGTVDQRALEWLLSDPFFSRPFPKSTGRELFGLPFLHRFLQIFPQLSQADSFATLCELTVVSVAMACRKLLAPAPHQVVLCGGGVKNLHLANRLQLALPESEIVDSAALGVDVDTLEAQAFAWFAVRTLRNLPSSMPGATGAKQPAVLGAIHPAG
ncbi:MAG: anhydro-N-acetylmuramic acid kinase [Magnetococcales bacterium]|nr:anhydro-N-acetylmuramic acid kinase [Magnetococcales bacterium]MBF0113685.1 anhydro-N-acetylmuramic acid kinase [Magnetococcales bacterium]